MHKSSAIYIVAAQRSPVGRLYGGLSGIRPDDLLAELLRKTMEGHPALQPEAIEALIVGAANQAGEDNRNLARMGVLLSNLPVHIYCSTVNSLCVSGMDAFIQSARALALGEGELYLAGGVDSMSRSPWVVHRESGERVDSTVGWRFNNPNLSRYFSPLSMPETAELLALRWKISRAEQDRYTAASRLRYLQAEQSGAFDAELVPFKNPEGDWVERDEQPKLLNFETLSKLPAVLKDGEHVSLGNAARIGDGAALLALASEAYVQQQGIRPLARIHSWATAAEHPDYMGLTPVSALRKALRAGRLSLEELAFVELQEAFAVQLLACVRELRLPMEKVNPYGGAISIGNPLGMGAARMLVSLTHALQRQSSARFAAAACCAGLGVGTAVVLERC